MEVEYPTQLVPRSIKKEEKEEVVSGGRRPTEHQRRREPIELVIHQAEQNVFQNYSIREEGASLGRHKDNTVTVVDELVSRFHAEIQFERETFFIRDLGSSGGTFIRVEKKIELHHGMVI